MNQAMDTITTSLNEFSVLTLMLLASFSVLISIWYYKFYSTRKHINKLASIVPGPIGFPFLGNALSFVNTPTKILEKALEYCKKYHPIFKLWFGSRVYFVIQDPEHLNIILNSPHCLNKAKDFYGFMESVVGHGVFSAPDYKWKRKRKIIRPAFNQRILDSFVPIFVEQNEILCNILAEHEGKEYYDVFEMISAANMDIICETAMGVKTNSHDNTLLFGKWLDTTMMIVFLRMCIFFFYYDCIFNLTSFSTKLDEAITNMKNYTKKIIVDKRIAFDEKHKTMEKSPEAEGEAKVFLDQLLELTKIEDKFTDDELMDEVMTFTIAGSDTNSTTAAFGLTMLGMFPEIQQKVYDEIMDILGHDRPITPEDMPKFKYMERFIKETLRLFPPGAIFARDIKHDVKLDEKYTLPGGTTAVVISLALHRSEKYWKDPLKFDPDRFLPEEVATRHPYCYLAFSGGTRNCMGIKFAMMALKSMFSAVLRKYVIKTSYKSVDEIVLKTNVLLRPAHGYKVIVEARS